MPLHRPPLSSSDERAPFHAQALAVEMLTYKKSALPYINTTVATAGRWIMMMFAVEVAEVEGEIH